MTPEVKLADTTLFETELGRIHKDLAVVKIPTHCLTNSPENPVQINTAGSPNGFKLEQTQLEPLPTNFTQPFF